MIINPNPLLAILPKLRRPSLDDPDDSKRDRDTLRSVTLTLIQLLFGGEFHEETLDSTGTIIPHQLRRRPKWRFILRQDANQVVYDDYENWNDQKVVMKVGAGTMNVVFYLLVALMCVLPATARAAECATYGYAQKQVIRFWLCALAADTTTGAVEGDYRYNKDTDVLQTYNGAAWANVGGGGGGAPTTATYITQTPDAGLSAEQAMSLLGTGLELNTTGTGVQSIYAGSACGGTDKATSISAAGVVTCSPVAYANVTGAPTIPTDVSGASYWTRVAEANLSSESALGALGTGLVISTTGTGAPSIYAGSSCGAGTKAISTSASGVVTCTAVSLTADVSGDLPYSSLIQSTAADVLIGRRGSASGAGDFGEVAVSDGTLTIGVGPSLRRAAISGDVSIPLASNTATISLTSTLISGLLDTLSAVQGSVLYRGASGWAALAPSASGYVLSSNGSSADPAWSSFSRVLPIRIGLPRPPCNAVRRVNWQRTNCS